MRKQMKIFSSSILFIALIATLLLWGGCGSTPAAIEKEQPTAQEKGAQEIQEVIELKLAHFWASTHFIETQLVQEWSKEIQDATDGRIKIISYPSGTLLASTETYDGVLQGVADIGMSCYAYNRGRFPVMEAFMTPGIVFNNSKSASMAATEGIKELNPEELQNTQQLMTWGAGPGHLLMKSPVKNRAELQGVEIGVTGGERAEAIKLLGATPVVMSMAECYDAQSKGVIKGTLSTLSTMKGFRLGEVTNSVTLTPFIYNQLFYMVMNKEKWNSLSPEMQDIIMDVTEKFHKEHVIGLLDIDNEESLEYYMATKELEIYELSDDETAEWIELIKPVINDQINTLNEKGLPGEDIIKAVQNLAEKYNEEYK